MFQVVGDDQNNTEIQTISTKSSMSRSFVSKDLWGKITNVEYFYPFWTSNIASMSAHYLLRHTGWRLLAAEVNFPN